MVARALRDDDSRLPATTASERGVVDAVCLKIVRRQNEVLARGRLMAIASRPLRGAAIRAADDAVPRRVAREIRLDLGGNSDASQ